MIAISAATRPAKATVRTIRRVMPRAQALLVLVGRADTAEKSGDALERNKTVLNVGNEMLLAANAAQDDLEADVALRGLLLRRMENLV